MRAEFLFRMLLLPAGLVLAGAEPASAARPLPGRLPSAVAAATPGTGSAPIHSAGVAGAPALAALTRKKPARRPRGARLGSLRPL
jgi:hypothetical protein